MRLMIPGRMGLLFAARPVVSLGRAHHAFERGRAASTRLRREPLGRQRERRTSYTRARSDRVTVI
jgi:hypothetical protein